MSTSNRSTALAAPPRFVELVRVSTKGQADRDTPEMQRRALDRLRDGRPGVLVERIEAPGISGALPLDQRPDLQRLAQHTRAHAYDELRVYDVDRLTRAEDPRERFAVYGMAMDAGAVIIDAAGRTIDPRDASGLGEIDYYLRTLFASRERARIIARTRDGKLRGASQGRFVAGHVPYGRRYDKARHAWELDLAEAQVYRRLFALVIDEGLSTRKIAARLNAEGVPTRENSRWYAGTVGALLRDRRALGEHSLMGHPVKIPPIVDGATFDAAAKRLRANRSKSGPTPTVPAMLRRLMVCGECGYGIHIGVRGTAGKRVPYYFCGSVDAERVAKCRPRAKYIRVTHVDEAVRAEVERFLRRPTVLRSAAGLDAGEDGGWEERIEEAEREIRRVDAAEQRVLRLVREELVSEQGARTQFAELRAKRAALTTQRATAEAAKAAAHLRGAAAEDLEQRVAAIARRIDDATPEDWAELMALIFPRQEPYGLRLYPGRIDGLGLLPLDEQGETALADASSSSWRGRRTGQFREAVVIPFRLSVRVQQRKARALDTYQRGEAASAQMRRAWKTRRRGGRR